MSTATIEELNLEGLLEGTPPCQAHVDGRKCERPAVTRVTVTCARCGPFTGFLCSRCLDYLVRGEALCVTRDCRARITRWTST